MRILVLGGDGMLGHQLLISLRPHHEIKVTLRQSGNAYQHYNLFNQENSYFGLEVRLQDDLLQILSDFKPNAIINAVGIIKQRALAKEAIPSLEINSLFPQRLALICEALKIRLIHISTDCVFSGKQGNYKEEAISDAKDLYGRTKYLGEVISPSSVTLRTSIIGLELTRKISLIEWFLAQKGKIKGYCRAIYSGVTTMELGRVIENILANHPSLTGIWHVSSEPINKYHLLIQLAKLLEREDIEIEPDDEFVCDRSLNGEAIFKAIKYKAPPWDTMLKELVNQIKQRTARITCSV